MLAGFKRFTRNRGAAIGLCILLVVLLTAVIGPLIYTDSPWKMVQRPFLPPFTVDGLPLGTDALGRDVMACPSVRRQAISAASSMTR